MRGIILAFLEIIYYFCHVNECCIDIYTKSKDLPTLLEGNYFHSRELFIIYEQTPGCTPYMVVVSNKEGQTLAQLLVAVNRKGNWFPPYIYTRARARGRNLCQRSQQGGALLQNAAGHHSAARPPTVSVH